MVKYEGAPSSMASGPPPTSAWRGRSQGPVALMVSRCFPDSRSSAQQRPEPVTIDRERSAPFSASPAPPDGAPVLEQGTRAALALFAFAALLGPAAIAVSIASN